MAIKQRTLGVIVLSSVSAIGGGAYLFSNMGHTSAGSNATAKMEDAKIKATNPGLNQGSPEFNGLMAQANQSTMEEAIKKNSSHIDRPVGQQCTVVECQRRGEEISSLESEREQLETNLRSATQKLNEEKVAHKRTRDELETVKKVISTNTSGRTPTVARNCKNGGKPPEPTMEYYKIGTTEFMTQNAVKEERSAISEAMSEIIGSTYAKPTFVSIVSKLEEDKASGSAGGSGGDSKNDASSSGELIMRASDVTYAIMEMGANSDVPGPIYATIGAGKYRGGKLLGSFKTVNEYNVISFNKLTLPDGRAGQISAIAVDPRTKLVGVADDVNRHLLLKLGAIAGASFIKGYGKAIEKQSQTVVPLTDNQYAIVTTIDDEKLWKVAMADVGDELVSMARPITQLPTTVQVFPGTGVGVLVMDDVYVK